MARVRVLRLLEYTYENQEMADSDMSHWQLPANGSKRFGFLVVIRSAVITNLNWEDPVPSEDPLQEEGRVGAQD